MDVIQFSLYSTTTFIKKHIQRIVMKGISPLVIICEYEERFQREVYGDDEKKKQLISFWERQVEKHHYDLQFSPKSAKVPPYYKLLIDKSYPFLLLARLEKAYGWLSKAEVFYDGTILDEIEKLPLLRSGGGDTWDDDNLYHLSLRRTAAKKNKYKHLLEVPLMSYTEIIDDLGVDPYLVDLWGEELNYKEHFGRKVYRDFRNSGGVPGSGSTICSESQSGGFKGS